MLLFLCFYAAPEKFYPSFLNFHFNCIKTILSISVNQLFLTGKHGKQWKVIKEDNDPSCFPTDSFSCGNLRRIGI